jgi:hypothetical protein
MEVITKLLERLTDQQNQIDRLIERVDRQDGIILLQQTAIKLASDALQGHQQVLEASQPEPKTGPPPLPPIIH